MNWLMEKLNRFSETHQNIELRLNVTEKLMDVAHGEADIGVRCGKGDWSGVNKTWLMDEKLFWYAAHALYRLRKLRAANGWQNKNSSMMIPCTPVQIFLHGKKS